MRPLSPNRTDRLLAGVPVVMTLTLGRAAAAPGEPGPIPPVTLSFADLFTVGAPTLAVSPAAQHLNGRRIRLVGFVAQLARRPSGAFYLCPRPVTLDEEAGGTADLPAEAVRVTVPAAADRLLTAARGRVEVVGLLDIGYREEANGDVSWIRLTADGDRTRAPHLKENK